MGEDHGGMATADNVFASFLENSIPNVSCDQITVVADRYFQDFSPKISAKNIAIEAKAIMAAQVICNQPADQHCRGIQVAGIFGRPFRTRQRRTERLRHVLRAIRGAQWKNFINDVADVRAGQAFLKQSVERMEDKLDKALDEHEDRIRALETYKDKQLGLMSLAAFLGGL